MSLRTDLRKAIKLTEAQSQVTWKGTIKPFIVDGRALLKEVKAGKNAYLTVLQKGDDKKQLKIEDEVVGKVMALLQKHKAAVEWMFAYAKSQPKGGTDLWESLVYDLKQLKEYEGGYVGEDMMKKSGPLGTLFDRQYSPYIFEVVFEDAFPELRG